MIYLRCCTQHIHIHMTAAATGVSSELEGLNEDDITDSWGWGGDVLMSDHG